METKSVGYIACGIICVEAILTFTDFVSQTGGGVAKAAEEGYRRTPSPTRIGRSGSLRGSKPAESSGRATPTTGSPKNPEEESDNGTQISIGKGFVE